VLFLVAGIICGAIFHKELGEFLSAKGPLRKFVIGLGWIGPVVFGAFYALWTVMMLPGSLLTLAAGVIFPQLYQAFVSVSVGSTIGACLAFLLGKSFLRNWVEEKIKDYPIFTAIDGAIAKRGLIMVLLLRLSPVIPFNILNYGLSVTGISFLGYFFGSWVGMAPGTFLYIYIAWAAAHAISSGNTSLVENILIYGVGSVVTIGVVVLVTILAKRAIDAEMLAQKEKGVDNVDIV